MHILYLTHDLTDPTTAKRVRMLVAGGATVSVAGFRREDAEIQDVAGSPATNLGRTYNRRFMQRGWLTVREVVLARKHYPLFASADIIIARNLEMLAIAVRGRSLCYIPPRLVYEVLDIHRLLLRNDVIGVALRHLEGWLSRRTTWLVTSSPAFVTKYFERKSHVRLPVLMLENKVLQLNDSTSFAPVYAPNTPRWRVGWFGAIRCRKSLDILCKLARENPQLVEVVIRGRPAYDQFENFDAQVSGIPNLYFLGSYRNPEDLSAMYGEIHFSWCIDMFEEGLNSTWLLPNRLYESGLFGVVPLAAEGVETSNFIRRLGIGHTLAEPKGESLVKFLSGMTPKIYAHMKAEMLSVPKNVWVHKRDACVALVNGLVAGPATPSARLPQINTDKPVLVVIPCLNESAHIGALIHYLLAESETVPMTIVVADGGSTDGTAEIVRRLAIQHSIIRYLHNPKRIQSAALNLAVKTYGNEADLLIRLDAHAEYPTGFCETLLSERIATRADSVVVSVITVGKKGFQEAAAAAQNSKLGNGGSSHRSTMNEGKWVDHGHHALIRISAYRAVGGYDESFTHNEDAELDARLREAGYRIWLTPKTTLCYFPRETPLSLFQQYKNYGMGRVRTMLKHRQEPKLRQMLPVAVAPAIALLFISPFYPIVALPFLLWAGACLFYGVWLGFCAKKPAIALSGPASMLMHGGWSLGFWIGLVRYIKGSHR